MNVNEFHDLIFFGMVFMWIGYPMLVLALRYKFYPLSSRYVPGQFVYYAFVIGFCVTLTGIILSSIFYGFSSITVGISILLGFISETVILFPDKLEQRFNVNLQSFSHMRKYIIILIFSFIAILQVIKIIMHY